MTNLSPFNPFLQIWKTEMTRKITVLILTNSAFSDEKTYSSPKQLLLYIQCINNCCALPCSTWAKSSSLQIIATTTHMKKKEQHFFSTSQAAQDKKQAERLIAFSLKIGLSKTANKQMLFRPVVVYINKHGKKIDSCQTQEGRTQCPILVAPWLYGHTNCTSSKLQLWLVEVTLTYKGTKLLPVKKSSHFFFLHLTMRKYIWTWLKFSLTTVCMPVNSRYSNRSSLLVDWTRGRLHQAELWHTTLMLRARCTSMASGMCSTLEQTKCRLYLLCTKPSMYKYAQATTCSAAGFQCSPSEAHDSQCRCMSLLSHGGTPPPPFLI